jgi:hypothetical protein
VRAVVADPQAQRRRTDAPPEIKRVLHRARCATRSASGKALLRQRGQHLERAFCHVLDHGGLRRATLRGTENLSKRYLMGALSFNLSLLLRTLFGIGTPKQWLAAPRRAVLAFWSYLKSQLALLWKQWIALSPFGDGFEVAVLNNHPLSRAIVLRPSHLVFSTAC